MHVCRYEKQVKLLQREHAELQQEAHSCGVAKINDNSRYPRDNPKYIEDEHDRRLAQKHYSKKQELLRVGAALP